MLTSLGQLFDVELVGVLDGQAADRAGRHRGAGLADDRRGGAGVGPVVREDRLEIAGEAPDLGARPADGRPVGLEDRAAERARRQVHLADDLEEVGVADAVEQAERVSALAADAVALGVAPGGDRRGEARPPHRPRRRVAWPEGTGSRSRRAGRSGRSRRAARSARAPPEPCRPSSRGRPRASWRG